MAERRVEADTARWRVSYTVSGKNTQQIPQLYEQSEGARKSIVDLLLDNGFDESEIEPGVVEVLAHVLRDENQELVEERHVLIGSIDIDAMAHQ